MRFYTFWCKRYIVLKRLQVADFNFLLHVKNIFPHRFIHSFQYITCLSKFHLICSIYYATTIGNNRKIILHKIEVKIDFTWRKLLRMRKIVSKKKVKTWDWWNQKLALNPKISNTRNKGREYTIVVHTTHYYYYFSNETISLGGKLTA